MSLRGIVADERALRDALGQFATGVTVVTTRTRTGEAVGLTVNSFSSVSLDPPLVLWSLAHRSARAEAFRDCEYFAVNVLGAEQENVALRFAQRTDDPFRGLAVTAGIGGLPLLRGVIARFECLAAGRHAGGDHDILLGEVLRFDRSPGRPLLFHGGRFAGLAEPASAAVRPLRPPAATGARISRQT